MLQEKNQTSRDGREYTGEAPFVASASKLEIWPVAGRQSISLAGNRRRVVQLELPAASAVEYLRCRAMHTWQADGAAAAAHV